MTRVSNLPSDAARSPVTAPQGTKSYRHRVYISIREIDPEVWNFLRDPHGDPYMDPRFIEAVENSMGDVCRFRHVVFEEKDGWPVAVATLCRYVVDGAALAEGTAKKILGVVGRVLPRLVQQRLILCGLPISTGDSHVRFAAHADRTAVLTVLDRLLCEFASEEHARFIIFKEFGPDLTRELSPLESLGYRRADSYPMNCAVTKYADFNDYLASLSSKRRRMLRGSMRKLENRGLRIVHLPGGEEAAAAYTDDVHRLYENVLVRSKVQFEHLPAEFIRELARRLPDKTAFTFIYEGDKVVGYSLSVHSETSYHGLVLGIDYERNREYQLYFNLMYLAIDAGLKRRPQHFFLGQTADTTKHAKLDCYQVPVSIFVKGARRSMRLALRYGFDAFFPPRPLSRPQGSAEVESDSNSVEADA